MRQLLFIACILFCFSCSEKPERTLSRNEKKLLDSLYHAEISLRSTYLDSICIAGYGQLLEYYIDSLRSERLAEIKAMLDEEK